MIEARSASQLRESAKALNPGVKPRGRKRTTQQVEKWSARSVLIALANTYHIKYPVNVITNDKPDLDLDFGIDKVGIEITEAVPEDYARALVLANNRYPDALVDRSLFRWGAPRKTNAELHEILKKSVNRLSGPGWHGDSVEREWGKGMADTIEAKLKKINKSDYRSFPRYWLAIYDNLRGPMLDLKLGVKYLRSSLHDQNSQIRKFQYIFIEVGRTMVAISRGGQLRYFKFELPSKIV